MRIGIVGGTGKEGGSLAVRWARAGHEVILGSRDVEKARARAAALAAGGFGPFEAAHNRDAARSGEVVVLSVPYGAHAATLRAIRPELAGK
ncbi:MAG TPA: NAD(P)-binding domain-containing protein, partial [Polyangiaceae bacterium]|nr:NAD(P)-binding domain-containing protein [Polyangiaceae bacterium]